MRKPRPLVIPSLGVIKGGRLHEWYFHFLHFRVSVATRELLVVCRCTPPAWPFPCDIPLDSTHFMQLRPIRGTRAKRLDAQRLVESAYVIEGLPVPQWLIDRRSTLRAAVKRSTTRIRRSS